MAELQRGVLDTEVEWITIRGGSSAKVDAIHARPTGMPLRGVVVLPDIFGTRPLFEDIAERLASHGAAVMVIEPFADTPPEVRAEWKMSDRNVRLGHLDDRELLEDLESAATALIVQDDVSEVAVLGFCYGGHMAFKASTTEIFDRAVAFYGILHPPEDWQGPGRFDPMDRLSESSPTLAIFGSEDALVPLAQVEELRARWSGRTDCQIHVVDGADHGFVHDPDRPTHRPADAATSWNMVLDFLGLPRP